MTKMLRRIRPGTWAKIAIVTITTGSFLALATYSLRVSPGYSQNQVRSMEELTEKALQAATKHHLRGNHMTKVEEARAILYLYGNNTSY